MSKQHIFNINKHNFSPLFYYVCVCIAEKHTVGFSQSSLIHLVGPSDCTLLSYVHGGESGLLSPIAHLTRSNPSAWISSSSRSLLPNVFRWMQCKTSGLLFRFFFSKVQMYCCTVWWIKYWQLLTSRFRAQHFQVAPCHFISSICQNSLPLSHMWDNELINSVALLSIQSRSRPENTGHRNPANPAGDKMKQTL